MQFLEWDFSQDLSTAVHVEGDREIRFTRAERSLLQALMSYKGRIWERDALLDAVSGIDAESSDRSIDFLINRLRRKLGDSARQPRYIETRYGEGYVWIAGSSPFRPSSHAALPAIRSRLRGSAVMSYCDRPHAERAILHQHAESLLVLRLQGFLFFGAANRVYQDVRHEIDTKLSFLIIDFRDVQGVDATSLPMLLRIQQLSRDHGVELILASVRPVLASRLGSIEARRFHSLDSALEWRETRVLETSSNRLLAPAERTLASCLAEELSDAEAATVLRHFEAVRVPAGTTLIQAATYGRDMFFLESGTADVVFDVEGTWVRLSRIWPGTLFGEIGFHYGGPRTATIRTLEECSLVCMERPAVARLEADFPCLAIALHRYLARCSAKRLVFYNDMMVDHFRSTLS